MILFLAISAWKSLTLRRLVLVRQRPDHLREEIVVEEPVGKRYLPSVEEVANFARAIQKIESR